MFTYVATCNLSAHLRDVNAKFDANDIDGYHNAFDAYNDDLDKIASIAFKWAKEYEVSRITLNRESGSDEDYYLRLDDKPTLINADGISGVAAYIENEDELASMLCYEPGIVTVSALVA